MNEKAFLPALLNDERNSALFYAYLSQICSDIRSKNVLENIAVNCGLCAHKLILRAGSIDARINNAFGQIEKNITLQQGIKWAIRVETESIDNIRSFAGIAPLYGEIIKDKQKRIKMLDMLGS